MDPSSSSLPPQLVAALSNDPLSVTATPKELLEAIRTCTDAQLESLHLAPPPRIRPPPPLGRLPPPERLAALQAHLHSYQYNHTPNQFVSIDKNKSYRSLMETAAKIQATALPIRCIEACLVGLLLTNAWAKGLEEEGAPMDQLDRYPIGFKTTSDGVVHRHIILAVHHRGTKLFGALGSSRRMELGGKPLVYPSMSSLLMDYATAYEQWHHTVLRIRLGLPAPCDAQSTAIMCWRYLHLDTSVPLATWHQGLAPLIDTYVEQSHTLRTAWRTSGVKKSARDLLPPPPTNGDKSSEPIQREKKPVKRNVFAELSKPHRFDPIDATPTRVWDGYASTDDSDPDDQATPKTTSSPYQPATYQEDSKPND